MLPLSHLKTELRSKTVWTAIKRILYCCFLVVEQSYNWRLILSVLRAHITDRFRFVLFLLHTINDIWKKNKKNCMFLLRSSKTRNRLTKSSKDEGPAIYAKTGFLKLSAQYSQLEKQQTRKLKTFTRRKRANIFFAQTDRGPQKLRKLMYKKKIIILILTISNKIILPKCSLWCHS